MVALTLVWMGLLTYLDRSLGHPPGLRQAATPLSFALAAVPVMAWTSRRPGSGRAWLLLGPPKAGTWAQVVLAAICGLVLLVAVALVCWQLPAYRSLRETQVQMTAWSTPPQALALLGTHAVMPALFEELFFRGWTLERLRRSWSPSTALLAQAAVFAAAHGPGAPVAGVIGVLNGWLVIVSGSLWPGIALHFLINALAIAGSYQPVP
ncbi:MAG: CPBP family intramembrane metalloprotease [Candidatus Eisenbacteria bacterium]|nr:CPBP family intramembrane metalloprotease [Candidatus Eisenbacteria bacterium]